MFYLSLLQVILPFCDSCALCTAFLYFFFFFDRAEFVMTVRLVDSIDVTRWWLADAKVFGKLREKVNIYSI